jgi:4-amino-4-deoxy-L-arabinose transferase-like glycosyltransferase
MQRPTTPQSVLLITACAILLVAVVYVPFMSLPMMRTTGDEKVYIAQAMEMAGSGTWFKQTLGGVPSYYKGPAHYVLLRVGFLLFGAQNPFAFLFMNAIAVVIAGVATGFAVFRLRNGHRDALKSGCLVAGMMMLNVGLFSHAHASQMEVELIAVYALLTSVMIYAGQAMDVHPHGHEQTSRHDFILWTLAGVAGWFKSPIYSVLTGTSILVWWTLMGQLQRKLSSRKTIAAIALGVATGFAAYLPAVTMDWAAFNKTFLQRENMAKGGNEHSWYESLVPLATLFLFPFWGIVASSCMNSIKQTIKRRAFRYTNVAAACVAVIFPTVTFFAFFPFRSHIYYLPIIPAIYIWATHRFMELGPGRRAATRVVLWVETILLSLAGTVVIGIMWWMPTDPRWMPMENLLLATGAVACGAMLLARSNTRSTPWRIITGRVAGAAGVLIGLSFIMVGLGRADLPELNHNFARNGRADVELVYVDSIRHTWSEWGLLGGLIGRPVKAVRTPEEIETALIRGAVVLASRDADLAAIKARFDSSSHRHGAVLKVTSWNRWQTHGRDANGKSGLAEAILSRSWAPIQRKAWILQMVDEEEHQLTGNEGAGNLRGPGITTNKTNVILVTWDGVRPTEFFSGSDPELHGKAGQRLLPYFWTTLAPHGLVLGRGFPVTTIANTVVMSLPAYQSILSGTTQWCFSNECGGITDQTISDRLVFQEGIAPEKVATVASWGLVGQAATSGPGSGFVNAGNTTVDDGTDDPVFRRLSVEQAAAPTPWRNARYDRFTHAIAMHWLKKHQPRFMHIAYNDTDEYGHRGEYPQHMTALRANDNRLRDLVETLAESGEYGKNTCLILTTDHGRGSGANWTRHSNGQPLAARIWMYMGCPFSSLPARMAPDRDLVTHLDIRPTIEVALGLEPRSCQFCGEPVTRLAPSANFFAVDVNQ